MSHHSSHLVFGGGAMEMAAPSLPLQIPYFRLSPISFHSLQQGWGHHPATLLSCWGHRAHSEAASGLLSPDVLPVHATLQYLCHAGHVGLSLRAATSGSTWKVMHRLALFLSSSLSLFFFLLSKMYSPTVRICPKAGRIAHRAPPQEHSYIQAPFSLY